MIRRNESPKTNEPELRVGLRTQKAQKASHALQARVAIARAIIEARLEKGWTQEDLAKAASTKQSRISELESGRGNPTLDTIEGVAQALGLDISLVKPHVAHIAEQHGYVKQATSVLHVAMSALYAAGKLEPDTLATPTSRHFQRASERHAVTGAVCLV